METGTVVNDTISILVADDEPEIRGMFQNILGSLGYKVFLAADGLEAMQILDREHIDIAIADYRMPNMDGMEFLQSAKGKDRNLQVVIISGYGTIDLAVEAMRMGAYDYITKPFSIEDVEKIIGRLVETQARLIEKRQPPGTSLGRRYGYGRIIGTTPKMLQIFDIIDKVTNNPCTVLIQGESGTGKELIAQAVHEHSPNSDKPFIPVDCGAINENLIESELFGHEKGSFTGAYSSKKGLFRVAHGGTLFLDEIGEIPLDVQVKLLRALQERKIKPVGSTEWIPIEVRVIAATNRNLSEAIKDGEFRKDLFYRLNVVPIDVPPLRERRGDIPHLVDHFLKSFSRNRRPVTGISEEAMKRLMAYDWPGNVRELENAVESSIALGNSEIIQIEDLPRTLREEPVQTAVSSSMSSLDDIEKNAIIKTLEQTGGDKTLTAQILRINRSTLYRKLKKYGMED